MHKQKSQPNFLRCQREILKQNFLWENSSHSQSYVVTHKLNTIFKICTSKMLGDANQTEKSKAKQNKQCNWHWFLTTTTTTTKHLSCPFQNIFGRPLISCAMVRLSLMQLHWYMAHSSHTLALVPDGWKTLQISYFTGLYLWHAQDNGLQFMEETDKAGSWHWIPIFLLIKH